VWIDTDTLVALCQVAGAHGGIYSTHLRTEGTGVFKAVAEAIEIGRRANLPVDIIHVKIADRAMWGRMPELVAAIAAARARGQSIEANVYPYTAGQNDLASIVPPWAHEGGAAAMIKRLQDRDLRPRLEREILGQVPLGDWYNHYTATGSWEGMLLVTLSNPKYRRFEGQRMSAVIQTIGKPPIDVLFELLAENGGSVGTVFFHHSEDDMRRALSQPFVSIGSDGRAVSTEGPLSAGHPHPRFYGNVSARAGPLRPRDARPHARRRHPEDDIGERRQGPHLRSRAAEARAVGRCHDLRRCAHPRSGHLRAAASVCHRRRVRDRQRRARPRPRSAHACATRSHPLRPGPRPHDAMTPHGDDDRP
jgi:N-acyl-D-aspartate/D-glutamate deacylase